MGGTPFTIVRLLPGKNLVESSTLREAGERKGGREEWWCSIGQPGGRPRQTLMDPLVMCRWRVMEARRSCTSEPARGTACFPGTQLPPPPPRPRLPFPPAAY